MALGLVGSVDVTPLLTYAKELCHGVKPLILLRFINRAFPDMGIEYGTWEA